MWKVHRLGILAAILAALFAFSGVASAANTATLTWPAVTTRTDGTALTNLQGYNVYRGTSATTLTKFANVPAPTTTYVDSTPANGNTYYYYVTAIDTNGLESAPSNTGNKNFPQALPSSPGPLQIASNFAFQAYHAANGNFAMRVLGTAPASTQCDPLNAIICQGQAYYEIPLTGIVWSKAPQPAPMYALCS